MQVFQEQHQSYRWSCDPQHLLDHWYWHLLAHEQWQIPERTGLCGVNLVRRLIICKVWVIQHWLISPTSLLHVGLIGTTGLEWAAMWRAFPDVTRYSTRLPSGTGNQLVSWCVSRSSPRCFTSKRDQFIWSIDLSPRMTGSSGRSPSAGKPLWAWTWRRWCAISLEWIK